MINESKAAVLVVDNLRIYLDYTIIIMPSFRELVNLDNLISELIFFYKTVLVKLLFLTFFTAYAKSSNAHPSAPVMEKCTFINKM